MNQPPHVMAALREAREAREARERAKKAPGDSAAAASPSAAATPSRPRALPAACAVALKKAPRSVRLARTGGALLDVFALIGVVLYGVGPKLLCLFAAGVAFARMGGTWLHGVLPPMLQEGRAPSQADCATAAGLGLFSLAGLQSPSASLGIEWEIALENLAFCCTYGRRNCLTSQMYAGELSLSKILSLVWGKLSEGTVRCA